VGDRTVIDQVLHVAVGFLLALPIVAHAPASAVVLLCVIVGIGRELEQMANAVDVTFGPGRLVDVAAFGLGGWLASWGLGGRS